MDVGDRVTVEPYIACNKCEYCLTGLYQAHLPHMTYGVALNCDKPPYLWGAYSQYLFVAPGSRLHRIAPEVPAEAACLSSVIGNGVRWVRTKGEVRYGESVAIVGAGAQGLASVVAAKESGAYPIMVIGLTKDRVKFEVAGNSARILSSTCKKPTRRKRSAGLRAGKWRTSSLNAPACPRLCRRPFGSRGTVDGLCWRASTAAGRSRSRRT